MTLPSIVFVGASRGCCCPRSQHFRTISTGRRKHTGRRNVRLPLPGFGSGRAGGCARSGSIGLRSSLDAGCATASLAVDRDGDPGRWQLGRVALYDARSYAGDADHEPDLNGVMILFLAVGSRYGVEGIAASYAIKNRDLPRSDVLRRHR